MFVGVVMVLSGVLLGAAGPTILHDVGTVQGTGWAIMFGGIIALLAGSLGHIIHTRRSVTTNFRAKPETMTPRVRLACPRA
jgi:hypothetical protein